MLENTWSSVWFKVQTFYKHSRLYMCNCVLETRNNLIGFINGLNYTLKTIVLNLNPLELILALSKCSVGDSTISAILNLYL